MVSDILLSLKSHRQSEITQHFGNSQVSVRNETPTKFYTFIADEHNFCTFIADEQIHGSESVFYPHEKNSPSGKNENLHFFSK